MAEQPVNPDHAAEHEQLSQQYHIETSINFHPQDQPVTLGPELAAFIQKQGQVDIPVSTKKSPMLISFCSLGR
jgi:hypothetical protein